MDQPEGFVDKKRPLDVCKLLKTLYGLEQLSKGWNRRMHNIYSEKDLYNQSRTTACICIRMGMKLLIWPSM